MHDPFFTTEAEEMSRAFDPTNTDAPPSPFATGPTVPIEPGDGITLDSLAAAPTGVSPPASPPLRRSVAHHSVCPFCGTVNSGSTGPCGLCGMENTQATRAATRAKLGPWSVWQARNPSAPGMSFATLMALVAKGRITPRSVVRGPTTGQLWRYAARVKGLSREFGTCWHCGGELSKTARLCSACKRLQQPPINPDILLETSDTPQVAPRPPEIDPAHRGLLSLTAAPAKSPLRDEPASPEALAPAGLTPEGLTLAPDALSTEGTSLPMVDVTAETHPVELRAFQLPGEEIATYAAPRSGSVFRKLVIAALLGFIAMGAGLYFNPQVRPRYVQWFHNLMARLTGPDGRPIQTPNGATPDSSPSITATHREAGDEATHATPPTPLMGVSQDPKPRPTDITFGPGTGEAEPKPAPQNPADALSAFTKPAATIEISPPPSDPQALEQRATDLRERAIGFERRGDWATAVRQYELILQLHLPDGVGPTDIQARLDIARKLQQQGPSK